MLTNHDIAACEDSDVVSQVRRGRDVNALQHAAVLYTDARHVVGDDLDDRRRSVTSVARQQVIAEAKHAYCSRLYKCKYRRKNAIEQANYTISQLVTGVKRTGEAYHEATCDWAE